MTTNTVTLYVYDISNGLARTMSPMIVGKVVEGIWHSSIVVFNKEYYFQGGTFGDAPKTTPFGQPVKEIPLGNTELSKQDLETYIESIGEMFTSASYDIFKNNCNHYSNNLSEFLVGSHIPDQYLNQAKEFENSPIGGFIRSMNDAMKNQVISAHPGYNQYSAMSGNAFGNVQNANLTGHSSDVTVIKNDISYIEFISANEKVVIDFGADWCGPCKHIKPIFEALAKQYQGKIKFATVNIDHAKELAGSLGITSIPVFLFLKKGEEYKKIVGANQGELKMTLEKLNAGV